MQNTNQNAKCVIKPDNILTRLTIEQGDVIIEKILNYLIATSYINQEDTSKLRTDKIDELIISATVKRRDEKLARREESLKSQTEKTGTQAIEKYTI